MKRILSKYSNLIYVGLLALMLIVSFLGVIFYPNFFETHFYINPLFIYSAYVFATIFIFYKYDFLNNKANKLKIIALLFLVVLFVLSKSIEDLTYRNFIFSKLHIHYKELIYPISILLFDLYITNRLKIRTNIKSHLNLNTVIVILVVITLISNFLGISSKMKKDFIFMIYNFNVLDDQKLEYKLGRSFYRYIQFVLDNTSKKSNLLLPPFPYPKPAYPWPQTGNYVYLRYFLYPRSLTNGDEYNPNVSLENIDYVLIAWGETETTSGEYTHGWPKFDVPAEYIILMNEDGTTTKEMGDYKYKNRKADNEWGVIKVDKKRAYE